MNFMHLLYNILDVSVVIYGDSTYHIFPQGSPQAADRKHDNYARACSNLPLVTKLRQTNEE